MTILFRRSRDLLRGAVCVSFAVSVGCASATRPRTSTATAAFLDRSAIDAFWVLHDSLAADREPSADLWAKLLTTAAFREVGADSSVKQSYRLAFKPGSAADRARMRAAGRLNARVIDHLRSIPPQRAALDRFVDSLSRSLLIAESVAAAKRFLPSGGAYAPVPVSLLFYEPDGFAGPDRIVFDLSFARRYTAELTAVIAHEQHHAIAAKLPRLELPPRRDSAFLLLRGLRVMQSEGIADLIDKTYPLALADSSFHEFNASFNEAYRNAPSRLARIDSVLAAYDAGRLGIRDAGELLWSALTFGGHVEGMYLARAILAAHGRATVVGTLGNPFLFMTQYQSAATARGEYVFSEPAMRALEKLKARYFADGSR